MSFHSNVLETIGNTPMVELTKFDTGPCRLFAKLENQNPGGSIKDRPALSMVEAAEKSGAIKPGGTLIEATAGNTGLGLALVARQKGYRLVLVIPDKMSQEKIFNLQAMGAEVLLTRSDVGKGHPEYYQDMAQKLANETDNSVFVNQFGNHANPLAHETSTGPEIWAQMGHKVDAVVCGVGSGGTITGLGRFFAKVNPNLEMVLADPEGSVLADYINKGEMGLLGSWLVEGIGEDFIPEVSDLSLVAKAYVASDKLAFLTARKLLEDEGILAGSSSGTLLACALAYCRDQTEPKNVVTLVCDSGNKYLSKMYNDYWMLDQGFIEREQHGDLRDLIARPHTDKASVTVKPDDTLATALARMKLYDVSQLPVLHEDKVVGIIDESDILWAIHHEKDNFQDEVSTAMSSNLETVDKSAGMDALVPVFHRDLTAIIVDGDRFLGLITRIDLLNHLRRGIL
ncbi:MAG: pyridoxal-phosphate dependent enzyme [Rhodospirillaceae bacterium]|jgi:cystathionine beta-synthase|nr:pyridoxal-phosphate dependent enzyme [Rhodospirillaceae bacterium]MBT6510701.1 pyridoxal-phosphate dependent enzyme [Rhodospirillaceae bacterium]MBT7613159.1 pyridoxal-phosphate dependent enzyme [Rhodospirillaceae bacterium]MBT7647448.1 pyridoxal-phosphate dependent enzyme [Rhodospirillaceae bacterium]